ncbi:hypothetical protein RI570_21335 [Brucella pseudogrignonensis]|uniref:hypothetical protein n=1 Tax=Brucella pseudogrignonensis TaxID=419475 RepID=UPI0028BA726C|nr:hypothetical protein [Brucella pseudogrignonensis]MDT6940781.1 hypothetical protein [Brucella pseudogrignonensis]MDT6942596.1 hypothetical protein [Brucella pseudogrignonensis]
MNQIVPQDAPKQRQIIEVVDAVPLLDTSKFEHMQRIATGMARSTLIPDSLREEGTKDNKQELPFERVAANCFLIVNQAVRWGLDPFSVAQAVSVVHGKLCYEGKLVAAVIQAKLGFNLHHHFVGEGDAMRVYLSDRPLTGEIVATLKPGIRRPDMRLFDGSVSEWKTSGNGSPWSPKNFVRMLIYRGTRDWCRIYEPALMLGVYTPDEMLDMSENARAVRAKEVSTPSIMQRLQQRQIEPTASEGFNKDFVTAETETLASSPDTQDTTASDSVTSSASDREGGEGSVNGSTLDNSEDVKLEKRELMKLVVQLTALTKDFDGEDKTKAKDDVWSWTEGFMQAGTVVSHDGIELAKKITRMFVGVAQGYNSQASVLEDACNAIGTDIAELDEVQ